MRRLIPDLTRRIADAEQAWRMQKRIERARVAREIKAELNR
jgi:hypothetical protein